MKGMDIFCASQASTAICLSMEQQQVSSSSPSPSTSLLLGRAIDRYNPIIRDSTRIAKPLPLPPPCNDSQPPISPQPQKNQNKKKNKKNPIKENDDLTKILNGFTTNKFNDEKRKSITEKSTNEGHANSRKSWSCTRPGNFFSPPGSTRYLLSDKTLFNVLSDFDPAVKLIPAETSKSKAFKTEELCDTKPPSSSPNQVVVLRVSLHCRGCEKKMRKHISRMEGVTSFNIDFAAKKVTVVGNVTPSGVLSSISKVKNAQLWSPAISTTSVPPLNFSNSIGIQECRPKSETFLKFGGL